MASGFGAKGSEGRCYPLWQGFSKVVRFLVGALRVCCCCFPSSSAWECHRESNRISLERREVFFFLSKGGGGRLLLRTLGTPMRCSRRDVESFFWRCRSRRDDFFVVVVFFWLGLSATTAKTKRDGNARESSRRRFLLTMRCSSSFQILLQKLHVFSSNDDNENSACRRQRTRRNAKTFERTTWSVCITKKSFNARTRSKRKQTDNAGKKRRRYGPRSRNTSTIRAGERWRKKAKERRRRREHAKVVVYNSSMYR